MRTPSHLWLIETTTRDEGFTDRFEKSSDAIHAQLLVQVQALEGAKDEYLAKVLTIGCFFQG